MLRRATNVPSKAHIIRQAAAAVRFEQLPRDQRNPVIRAWVDERYPDFDWSTNPAALITGALKSKRWKASRSAEGLRGTRGRGIQSNLESALLLALRAGGFAQARQQVRQAQDSLLLKFIIAAGSISDALQLLETAEARVYLQR